MDGCQGMYVHSKFHKNVCELGCMPVCVHISDNRVHSFHLGLRVALYHSLQRRIRNTSYKGMSSIVCTQLNNSFAFSVTSKFPWGCRFIPVPLHVPLCFFSFLHFFLPLEESSPMNHVWVVSDERIPSWVLTEEYTVSYNALLLYI